MRKLITGLREFKANYVSTHLDLLEELAHGQKPRVLFITCSDSRIDPNRLTNTDLGELFVIRNAGNIVPPYGAANGGEGASIEYAIQALGIDQIVVCGHSHCGAMKGLLQLGKLEEQMPLVYDWLHHAEATRRLVLENYTDLQGEELLEVTIAENVLTQIENLRTYPLVRSRLFQGKLHIYGWVHLIETGEVFAFDPISHTYVPPQSQLTHEDSEDLLPHQYAYTSAPPVACEVPAWQAPVAPGRSQMRSTAVHPPITPPTANQSSTTSGSSSGSSSSPSYTAAPNTQPTSHSTSSHSTSSHSTNGNGATPAKEEPRLHTHRVRARRRVR